MSILALKPEMMGFIFYAKSARNCTLSSQFFKNTDFGTTRKVGVFVNESLSKIVKIHKEYQLDLVQLHGSESVEYCMFLKELGINIIKVFSIGDEFDFNETKDFQLATYFLFDTKGKLPGGNGVQFDWKLLSKYRGSTRFLLSGGIGPDHQEFELTGIHAACAGVDINSRFELSPGLKDIELIKEFKGKQKS